MFPMKRYTARWRDGHATQARRWQRSWNMPDLARLIERIDVQGGMPSVYVWNGADWMDPQRKECGGSRRRAWRSASQARVARVG